MNLKVLKMHIKIIVHSFGHFIMLLGKSYEIYQINKYTSRKHHIVSIQFV